MIRQVIRAGCQALARFARLLCAGPLIRVGIIHGLGPFVMPNLSLPHAIYDPRSICNLILDEAAGAERPISNLALQKLLYFTHGMYLIETKKPLVTGFFEAWQYGPVHPVAYHAFKSAGANPILFRASIQDPFTHTVIPLPECTDCDIKIHVGRIVRLYAGLTPGRLVEVSHARDAPWRFVVDKAQTETILGLRISDDVILSRFKYHKVSIGTEPRYGEPKDEIPFDQKEELSLN
jgi:uncharacterized phage-associated protein